MSHPFRLIAIVGLPGSGKTVAADFFRSKSIPVLRFGDETDLALQAAGRELNEKNERFMREKLRRDLGMAAYAIKIEPRIQQAAQSSDKIVLDGMRSWEEYVFLKNKFPFLQVISIFASPQIRYARLAERPERPLSRREALSRDRAEIENLNSGGPIAIADHIIVNEKSKELFMEALELIYRESL